MESKLKTAEWIVKHYALDKSYQHNHAVQDWLYDAKILLIEEANNTNKNKTTSKQKGTQ